jgi:hypothetical protein
VYVVGEEEEERGQLQWGPSVSVMRVGLMGLAPLLQQGTVDQLVAALQQLQVGCALVEGWREGVWQCLWVGGVGEGTVKQSSVAERVS